MSEYNLIIVLIILLAISVYKYKTAFNPLVIFNFIWALTLFLYEFKMSKIQMDLNDRTIIIFWLCILSYNITFLVFSHLKHKKLIGIKFVKNLSIQQKIGISKNIVIIIFMLEIIYSRGVPLIWLIMGTNKTYFDYGIPSLHGAWCGLVICLGAYSLFKKNNDKWLYLGLGVIIISRQLLMSILVEGIIYSIYERNVLISKADFKKIPKWVLVVIGGLSVAIFTIVGNFRSGKNVMNMVFQAKEQYSNLPVSFKWIYSYMTFSISNFNHLVEITKGAVNNGASMLSEFLPTVVLQMFNIKVTEQPYFLVSPNYTVSTYLPNIYLDFGVSGITIFNCVIAAIGSKIYKNTIKQKNEVNMLLLALYIHNIVFLFFQNFFLYLPVVIQFLYIPIIFSEKRDSN